MKHYYRPREVPGLEIESWEYGSEAVAVVRFQGRNLFEVTGDLRHGCVRRAMQTVKQRGAVPGESIKMFRKGLAMHKCLCIVRA